MSEKMKLADIVHKVKDYRSILSGGSEENLRRIITYDTIGDGGVIDFSRIKYEIIRDSRQYDSIILEPGDILISQSKDLHGDRFIKTALIPEEGRGCLFDWGSMALSLKPGIIKPELVAAYLSSRPIREYIIKLHNDETISGHYHFCFGKTSDACEKILSLEITVPEKERQEKIAEFLALMKESYIKSNERKLKMELIENAAVSELIGGEKC